MKNGTWRSAEREDFVGVSDDEDSKSADDGMWSCREPGPLDYESCFSLYRRLELEADEESQSIFSQRPSHRRKHTDPG